MVSSMSVLLALLWLGLLLTAWAGGALALAPALIATAPMTVALACLAVEVTSALVQATAMGKSGDRAGGQHQHEQDRMSHAGQRTVRATGEPTFRCA